MPYLPPGFVAVTPFLHVEDAPAFMDFVQRAFGAEIKMNHEVEGRVAHAELTIEGAMIELSEARPEWPATRSAFHLYVPDVDAVHARALEAGATEIHAPADQPYGERSSALKDRWDNHWYPAHVTDMAQRTDA